MACYFQCAFWELNQKRTFYHWGNTWRRTKGTHLCKKKKKKHVTLGFCLNLVLPSRSINYTLFADILHDKTRICAFSNLSVLYYISNCNGKLVDLDGLGDTIFLLRQQMTQTPFPTNLNSMAFWASWRRLALLFTSWRIKSNEFLEPENI